MVEPRSIFGWGLAVILLENPAEIKLVFEARHAGDLLDIKAGALHKLTCPLQPEPKNILVRSRRCDAFEQSREPVRAEMRQIG